MSASSDRPPGRNWPPPIGWPPHLTTDDVVWWPEEARWVGRTSPHLTKKAKRAADEARDFGRKAGPEDLKA